MSTISQLTAVTSVVASDLVPLYSSANGDARKASMTVLAAFIQSLITAVNDKIVQYAAPSASGFNVQINDDSLGVWLVLTPVAGYAAGTLKLPTVGKCILHQEILVNCTQAITTLTLDGNGATVTGGPTTLAANAFFRLRFDSVTKTWYRVG